jgi:acyl dehydratase
MMGQFYEDHEIGMQFELGAYAFTAENIGSFRSRFAPVPFHADVQAQEDKLFGSFVAVGFHTCCAWMTCFLKTRESKLKELIAAGHPLPETGPGAGLANIRWPRPVHVGDVVTYRVSVAALRELATKPAWGLVTAFAEGHNQNGDLVVSFEPKMLTARRL